MKKKTSPVNYPINQLPSIQRMYQMFSVLNLSFLVCFSISQVTWICSAGEGALEAGEGPEDEVGHAEGEAEDGVAAEEGEEQAHSCSAWG